MNMLGKEEILQIQKQLKGMEIVKIYDGEGSYLVSTTNPNDDFNCDPLYRVDKKTLKSRPFSPMKDVEWYMNAKQHPIL